MGLILMKLLEFCQEVIILKCKNFLTHPFVPLCTVVRTGDLANHDNVAVAKAKRDTKDKGLRRCQVL